MADPFPHDLRPMMASLVGAPPETRGPWVYEEKYDGFRVLAYRHRGRVLLQTRNGLDRTADFPEVARAVRALPGGALVLDGEVVVLDAQGISRFQLMQRRHLEAHAVIFVLFDCLYAAGRDLRRHPLHVRRAILEALPLRDPVLQRARRMPSDGDLAYREAKLRGLEGIIAKRDNGIYRDGTRSDEWLKVKVRTEDEFVIGGYTAPQGARTHFGALLVGAYGDDGKLHYAGKVGTGFDAELLRALSRRFAPLRRDTSPFAERVPEKNVTWLQPRLVAQLAYTEITSDGRVRQAAFLGLRDDKKARDVHLPVPPPF